MATKSILKNINVRGREQVSRLVDAMEKAEAWRGKEVQLDRPVVEITKDKMESFFADYFASRPEDRA